MIDPSSFRWPDIGESSIEKVADFLRQGQTSAKKIINSFESELCTFFKVKHALLTCNGTAAAFSCFHALDLKPGNEIIGPAFTHWATLLPAVHLGCRIIFADLEKDSLSISIEDVKQKITPATRAVVACHMYGNPAGILELRELCQRHRLYLIEDISHAPGATVDSMPVGSFGHMAFCSMQTSKLISAGEGGFLLTNDSELVARAMLLGQPKRLSHLPLKWKHFGQVSLGYKFRIAPLMALLGRESFLHLDNQNAIRREMFFELRTRMAGLDKKHFIDERPNTRRVYWEYELLLQQDDLAPEGLAKQLCDQGILAAPCKFELLPGLPHFNHQPAEVNEFTQALHHSRHLLLLAPITQRRLDILDAYSSILQKTLQHHQTNHILGR